VSVKEVYAYFKKFGLATVATGASFRSRRSRGATI